MIGANMRVLTQLLAKEAGILLLRENEPLIEARLERLIYERDISSVARLIEMLQLNPDPQLKEAIIQALLVHETSFFRDTHPFSVLRDDILPKLIEKRSNTRSLRIWSAACSSGQEPYSIAMLIHDQFPQLATWNIDIVASDLSGPILTSAMSGRFHQVAVNRGLPASYLIKYFERDGLYWKLVPEIRNMVRFRPINLAKPWPFMGLFDIIMLRNVLIYFNDETRRTVLRRTRDVLNTDGSLILGASESTINIDRGFKLVKSGRTVFYQKSTT